MSRRHNILYQFICISNIVLISNKVRDNNTQNIQTTHTYKHRQTMQYTHCQQYNTHTASNTIRTLPAIQYAHCQQYNTHTASNTIRTLPAIQCAVHTCMQPGTHVKHGSVVQDFDKQLLHFSFMKVHLRTFHNSTCQLWAPI